MAAINISETLKLGFPKVTLSADDFASFKSAFKSYVDKVKVAIGNNENEEHIKNIINDFLRMSFYSDAKFSINTDGNIDSAIKENGELMAIIETKAPQNKAEMITENHLNRKALHEMVYYYLERAVDISKSKAMISVNCQIRRLIITDGLNWFLFDVNDIHNITDGKIENRYYQYKKGQLPYKNDTAAFYEELRQHFDNMDINAKLPYIYFNVEECLTKKTLITNVYKVLSQSYLIKNQLKINYEPHKLNSKFYHELLYIMGLKEVEKDNRIVVEIDKDVKNSLSYQINKLLTKKDTPDAEINQRIYELVIIWINRLLFIKLFEGQLISFNSDTAAYHILDNEKIQSFEDMESLFFEVLGKKNREDAEFFNRFAEIPYLNSSLFEKQDIETGQGSYHNGIMISELKNEPIKLYPHSVLGKKVKNESNILDYIIDFLNSYNFASDEANVSENGTREIIDAAVLGLIFEKLNGYKDGSTYTPSVITEYLAKESVEKAVIDRINKGMGWKCETLTDIYNKIDTLEQRKAINNIINSITICDPAVGSGHFLVSVLNRMIAVKKELGVLFIYNTDKLLKDCKVEVENDVLSVSYGDGSPFVYNRSNNASREIQGTLFNEKRIIIENCLFGSDINVNAVSICQLRLWIELLKNAYYENGVMETLPNIDINIKTGNSLTYYANFEVGASILKSNKNSDVDSKDLKLIKEYRDLVKQYKSCSDKAVKKSITAKIRQIKSNLLNANTQMSLDDMDSSMKNKRMYFNAIEWAFEFPEAIDENGKFIGFDIVIGNPPYIQLQTMHEAADDLEKMKYSTFARTGDIYCLFYELAHKLLKNEGILAYISSNKWMRAGYGEALRDFLANNTDPVMLIDFSGEKVFPSVTVDVNILIYRKSDNQYNTLSCIIKDSDWRNNLSDYVRQHTVSNRFDNSDSWVILSPVEQSIKRKIEAIGTPLKDWDISINYGIKTGFNDAFIIDGAKKDELIAADPKSAEIIRPILRGRDIKRYGFDFADLWLINTHNGIKEKGIPPVDINDYPIVKAHLDQYWDKISTRYDKGDTPYNLRNCIYTDDFSKQKIVWGEISDKPKFAIDNCGKYYVEATTFFMTGDHLIYLMHFLNSSLSKYFFAQLGTTTGVGTTRWKKFKLELFPIPKPNELEPDTINILSSNNYNINDIDDIIFSIYSFTPEEIDAILEFDNK